MSTYKVLQDVEAEDKLIGFITFRQFLYLMVAALSAFVAFGLFRLSPILGALPLPIVGVFTLLGLWRREDQPIETYLLAFLNFTLRPRRRLWNPAGVMHNVQIKVPPKQAEPPQKSPEEAKSQLKNLAQIIDTRGWSSKRPELQTPVASYRLDASDRLVFPSHNFTQDPIDIHEGDDIFASSAISAKMEELASSNAALTKEAAITKMRLALAEQVPGRQEAVQESAPAPVKAPVAEAQAVPRQQPPPQPLPTAGDEATTKAAPEKTAVSKSEPSDDILGLAHNKHLRVDQIAVMANRGSNDMEEGREVSLR